MFIKVEVRALTEIIDQWHLLIVDNFDLGIIDDLLSYFSDPFRKVNIFIIHKVTLIKTTHLLNDFGKAEEKGDKKPNRQALALPFPYR